VTVSNSHRANGFSLMEIIVVVGMIGVLSAMAAPLFNGAIQSFRLSGDARSVSNATAVAKMRAASEFSRVRLYVDRSAKTYRIQTFNKTSAICCWINQGGTSSLSSGVAFTYGIVSQPPPNTQGTIGQAPLCKSDLNVDIPNTACIMFNSRGVPIDSSLAPTTLDALYVSDGAAVFGITVAATGMVRTWRALPVAIPVWTVN
jgi:prepilin-type N-terminal cleavage/methylation domain-containing protein